MNILGAQESDSGVYHCVVTNSCDSVSTSPVSVSIISPCYANCDGSTGTPLLTGNDFQCFLDKYVANDAYANCDGVGGLTGNDFQCFINAYVAGCL